MTASYSFFGLPLRDDMPDRWPPNLPLCDTRDGSFVFRERTAEQVPVPRCLCTHTESQHGYDRRGRHVCHGSVVCGCASYREKASA